MRGRLVTAGNDLMWGVGRPAPIGVSVNTGSGAGMADENVAISAAQTALPLNSGTLMRAPLGTEETMRKRRRIGIAMTVLLVPFAGVSAQWPPDSIVNLQVLPKGTPLRELVGTMRDFASALGVRCTHCHVGTDPDNLATINFASDDRVQKRKAREMLRMVAAINRDLLTKVPERTNPPITVTCMTCHHGVTQPRDIRAVLADVALLSGADSVITAYRRLREQYYGSASYDFRPFMLANVAEQIAARSPDAAIAIGEFNLSLHPKDQQTYLTVATVHLRRADTASAVRVMTRAVEALPENAFLKTMLARLKPR